MVTRSRRFLLVGEGDFSFALAWARFHARRTDPIPPSSLTATSFDSEADVRRKYSLDNVESLRELGVNVQHEVDATRLGDANFNSSFDEVRFNFPHAKSRWRTQDNRLLLRNFFESCRKVLNIDHIPQEEQPQEGQLRAQVIVTLSGGQGGTPADREHRRENPADSWQIVDGAAAAQFSLVSGSPFDYWRWNRRGYNPRGHRRAIKGAPIKGAVEHRFVPEECMGEKPWRAPYFGKKAIWE